MDQTSAIPTVAMAACLDTPELLESILKLVNVKTLLLAQRVSRRFQVTIKGSPSLQRKLFLTPTTFKEAVDTADGEDNELRNWNAPYHKLPNGNLDCDRADLDKLRMINPLLLEDKSILLKPDPNRFELGPNGILIPSQLVLAPPDKWSTYYAPSNLPLDKTQSFLHMHLAHPMPETVRFGLAVGQVDKGLIVRRADVPGHDADGPRTFGKLVKAAEAMLERGP